MTKLLPMLTGTACGIYIYAWTQGVQFEAWVPLIWCFSCFVHDLYAYLEKQ